MMKFEVGMELYFVHSEGRRHEFNTHTKVTQVGRKWVWLDIGYRFNKEDMWADGRGYTSQELVDAILLLRGPGWFTRDKDMQYKWHEKRPVTVDSPWLRWASDGRTWSLMPQVTANIPWDKFCFKIGEPDE